MLSFPRSLRLSLVQLLYSLSPFLNMITFMDLPTPTPLVLFGAALMIGAGLYVIQRGRIVFPRLFSHVPYLRTHRRVSGYLYLVVLTLSLVLSGFGCRILWQYFT